MKKLFLMFALLCAMSANAYEYIPMLTNGKSWTVAYVLYFSMESRVIYTVTGDTLVNGRQCKKIHVENQLYNSQYDIAAYEENQKLYSYEYSEGDDPLLLLDFNRHVGDYIISTNDGEWGAQVTKVDYITVNGITRKRIVFGDDGVDVPCWVEGVGANFDCFASPYQRPTNGSFYYLLECRDNGKLIFSQSDFDIPLSVDNVTNDVKESNSKIYSQDGVRLNKIPDKGIYIKDGKKIAR